MLIEVVIDWESQAYMPETTRQTNVGPKVIRMLLWAVVVLLLDIARCGTETTGRSSGVALMADALIADHGTGAVISMH